MNGIEVPTCLYVASLRLMAEPAAVGRGREFVRGTLGQWRLAAHVDSAELVASELVTNAVKSAGRPGVIGVQLRMADARLYVEVWDPGEGAPVRRKPGADAESGRGLWLVEAVSSRWDVCRPSVGGKIVWSELVLADRASTPSGGASGAEWARVDAAFRQRVLA